MYWRTCYPPLHNPVTHYCLNVTRVVFPPLFSSQPTCSLTMREMFLARLSALSDWQIQFSWARRTNKLLKTDHTYLAYSSRSSLFPSLYPCKEYLRTTYTSNVDQWGQASPVLYTYGTLLAAASRPWIKLSVPLKDKRGVSWCRSEDTTCGELTSCVHPQKCNTWQ